MNRPENIPAETWNLLTEEQKQSLSIAKASENGPVVESPTKQPTVVEMPRVETETKVVVEDDQPVENSNDYDAFIKAYKPSKGQAKRIASVKATKAENKELRGKHSDESERREARKQLVQRKKENLRVYYATKAFNRNRIEFRKSNIRPFVGVLFTGNGESKGLSARREIWEFILSPKGQSLIRDGLKSIDKTPDDYAKNYYAYKTAFKLKA